MSGKTEQAGPIAGDAASARYELSAAPMTRMVQIYDTEQGQSRKAMTRYCCSMLLTDLGLRECRLHFVQGVLNDEINRLVIGLCRELGYVQIQLEVPAGTPATRHARFHHTRDGLDRYVIELGVEDTDGDEDM